jgi:hypothetical protein
LKCYLSVDPEDSSQESALLQGSFLKEPAMHEILIALAFVATVACPAIVAALPQREIEDES